MITYREIYEQMNNSAYASDSDNYFAAISSKIAK